MTSAATALAVGEHLYSAQERSLLFVAGTRAQEDLAIGWHGECLPLLAPILGGELGAADNSPMMI